MAAQVPAAAEGRGRRVAGSGPALYLLRHGQTVWNVGGRGQGRLDPPLTELGVQQAQAHRHTLAALPLTCAYVSPMGRAQKTASLALEGRDVPLTVLDELAEVDLEHLSKELSTFDRTGGQASSWASVLPKTVSEFGRVFGSMEASGVSFPDAVIRTHALGELAGLLPAERLARFPILAGARKRDKYRTVVPGGESDETAAPRAARALERIRADGPGDVLIVSHEMIGRLLRMLLLGLTPGQALSLSHPQDTIDRIEDGTLAVSMGGQPFQSAFPHPGPDPPALH